jgi:endonuclease/exonuclease/phosphatase family metal-dependent hydrolase
MPNVVVCLSSRTARFVQLVLVLIAIGSFAATASAQTTVTLGTPGTHINADLTIQGGGYAYADFSNSDALSSKVSTSESYTRRILLKFDTQNYIPANAVIQSAKLYLVLKTAESAENRPFNAYWVNQSFAKGQTNWYYYKDGQAWSRAGGDYGQNFGTTYVGNAVGATYAFDLTKMVQAAVNGQLGSRYTRVALLDAGAATSGNFREFYSTRALNSALWPRLVVTYGGSSATAPAPAPAPAPTTSSTLRVMQWNIHKTKDSNGVCNPDLIASGIAAQNVDVVSINEVNFFSGVCAWTFDMGEKLEALVEQKTGVTWYRQNVNPNGVGNVLLSRIRPVSSSSYILDYGRGVAQMTLVVNGRNVNVFSTHVEYDVASYRPIQINEARNFVNTFAEPRIVMGDFNTNPGTTDYYLMANTFGDAWASALSAGTAWSYNGTGATHGTSRFDYAFYSKVASLAVTSVKVPDMRVNGVVPSDHDPVISVFTVK